MSGIRSISASASAANGGQQPQKPMGTTKFKNPFTSVVPSFAPGTGDSDNFPRPPVANALPDIDELDLQLDEEPLQVSVVPPLPVDKPSTPAPVAKVTQTTFAAVLAKGDAKASPPPVRVPESKKASPPPVKTMDPKASSVPVKSPSSSSSTNKAESISTKSVPLSGDHGMWGGDAPGHEEVDAVDDQPATNGSREQEEDVDTKVASFDEPTETAVPMGESCLFIVIVVLRETDYVSVWIADVDSDVFDKIEPQPVHSNKTKKRLQRVDDVSDDDEKDKVKTTTSKKDKKEAKVEATKKKKTKKAASPKKSKSSEKAQRDKILKLLIDDEAFDAGGGSEEEEEPNESDLDFVDNRSEIPSGEDSDVDAVVSKSKETKKKNKNDKEKNKQEDDREEDEDEEEEEDDEPPKKKKKKPDVIPVSDDDDEDSGTKKKKSSSGAGATAPRKKPPKSVKSMKWKAGEEKCTFDCGTFTVMNLDQLSDDDVIRIGSQVYLIIKPGRVFKNLSEKHL